MSDKSMLTVQCSIRFIVNIKVLLADLFLKIKPDILINKSNVKIRDLKKKSTN